MRVILQNIDMLLRRSPQNISSMKYIFTFYNTPFPDEVHSTVNLTVGV